MDKQKKFYIDIYKEYLDYFVLDETLIEKIKDKNIIIELKKLYTLFQINHDVEILEKIINIYDITFEHILFDMHKKIIINNKNMEYPKQLMSVIFLNEEYTVLEIGSNIEGNIGRNTMIIGNIVKNMVVMECDEDITKLLQKNINKNNLSNKCRVEPSALSLNNLIHNGQNTKISNVIEEGYEKINIISYGELMNKYNIIFDCLVLDCDGSFFNILIEFPNIIDNIKLIIIENDFKKNEHEKFVKDTLINNNFKIVYCKNINSPYNWPYKFNFYEVYKKYDA